jgi:hypothetical protein
LGYLIVAAVALFVRRGFWITDDKRIAANIVAQENQCRSAYVPKEKPTSARPMPGTSLPPPP